MKCHRGYFLVALALFAAACVSLKGRMQSYMGHSDTELVSKWGAPDRQVTLSDSSTVMTWDSARCEQSVTFSKTGIATRW
jgi:hypothetical protein